MKVVALGTGAKSMISLWLLNPPALANSLCLFRLTKKIMKPIVQASNTQAPETDPAMIGVLAFFLNHTQHRAKNEPHDQCQHSSNGAVESGMGNPDVGELNTRTHGE